MSIAQCLPLTSAEEAHTLSRTGRLTGKLVLVPECGPHRFRSAAGWGGSLPKAHEPTRVVSAPGSPGTDPLPGGTARRPRHRQE